IGAPRPRRGRPDAVAPVVAVGEAAAGPANHAGLQRLQLVDQRFADAADVGDLGVLPDPDAVVDDAAEVFDEVAAEVWSDAADGLIEEDVQPRVDSAGRAGGRLRERAERIGGAEAAGRAVRQQQSRARRERALQELTASR